MDLNDTTENLLTQIGEFVAHPRPEKAGEELKAIGRVFSFKEQLEVEIKFASEKEKQALTEVLEKLDQYLDRCTEIYKEGLEQWIFN